MQQIADETFEYLGLHSFPSKCRLRAFEEAGKPTVVITTELPNNPGTSITNAAALIAAQVYQWLERPERGITLIEHYEKDGEEAYAEERFALVTFPQSEGGHFEDAAWRHIEKSDVEEMIAKKL